MVPLGQLQHQTLRQAARPHPWGIQHLDHEERLFQTLIGDMDLLLQLLQGAVQISPLVQTAHQIPADPQHLPVQPGELAKLLLQMLLKGGVPHIAVQGIHLLAGPVPRRLGPEGGGLPPPDRRRPLEGGAPDDQQGVGQRLLPQHLIQLDQGYLEILQGLPHPGRQAELLFLCDRLFELHGLPPPRCPRPSRSGCLILPPFPSEKNSFSS